MFKFPCVWKLLVFAEALLFLSVHGLSLYPSPPNVSVSGYTGGRFYSGMPNDGRPTVNFTFQNATVFVVPSTVGQIILECNASYPVLWNLVDSDVNYEVVPYIRVHTKRFAGDLFDPTTFNYSTHLTLSAPGDNHKFTGNYTCQHTGKRNIQTNIFIFWEASGTESLVHSKEAIETYLDKNGKVNLPCGVSNPKLSPPKLWKQSPTRRGKYIDTPIKVNKSISYSPKTGFTLNNVPDPMGKYKCVLDENDEDEVTITVKNATTALSQKSNATFTYDPEKNEVKCCSSTKRPPNIFLMHCDHATTCQLREHVLEPFHYAFSRARKNGNCASKTVQLFYHTVLIRCLGDGINAYKEMITPISIGFNPWTRNQSVKFKTFFSWEEIESQEMLAVEYHNNDNNARGNILSTLYDKQSVNVQCTTSPYYFSEGIYWAIRWKNKTLTYIHEPQSDPKKPASLLQTDSLSYTIDTSMEAFVCFAPVWNSSVWVIKSGFTYVNKTVMPTLIQNDTVEYTWYTNELSKEIQCEATGTPDPIITWNFTEIKINTYNYNITTTRKNDTGVITSTLKIKRVAHPTQGQYICSATNYGGTKTRTFNITVLAPSSWTTAVIVIIFCIVICILLSASVLIWKKTRQDQKAIRQLTAVHFKDATTLDQAVSVDVSNMTSDNGKMTNQLIS